jgi:hypothetical protein
MKYAFKNSFENFLKNAKIKNAEFDTSCFCVEKQAEIKAKCFNTN